MKTTILTWAALLAAVIVVSAAPLQTGFNYQGKLTEAGAPAGGWFDFRFTLHDTAAGGTVFAGPVTNTKVLVTNGLFNTEIDFGANIFNGMQYWLEIGARPYDSNTTFTTLAPRQSILPAPYALHADSAAGVASNAVGNVALMPNAVSADKIAPGQVVKSFNGLADDIQLAVEGDLSLRTNQNQLVLAALLNCNTYSNCYWNLLGNGNITAGVNFLGTIAGELAPLEFRVNNNRSLLHTFTAANTSPNIVGGYRNNVVNGTGGTIGGGGQSIGINRVEADWGTVGGGYSNVIQSASTSGTIGGGAINQIAGLNGAIGGGVLNVASNYSFVGGGNVNRSVSSHGVIGGGYSNAITVYDNAMVTIPTIFSSIVGGVSNAIIGGNAGTIGGGQANRVTGTGGRQVHYATIAGGQGNAILSDMFESHYSSICGGFSNSVRSAGHATIAGGGGNRVMLEGHYAAIGGGLGNTVDAPAGTISGGRSNIVAGPGAGHPDYATIGGGDANAIQSDSHYATVAGGRRNRIEGGAINSSIGGGSTNAIAAAEFATIAGGGTNLIADSADFSAISGGRRNLINQQSPASTVGGGDRNTIGQRSTNSVVSGGVLNGIGNDATSSVMGGGENNTINNSATNAVISGGRGNLVDTSAPHAVIPGGQQARATNYNQYAFASGDFSQTGDAQHSQYVLRNTSVGVAPTELFLDGVVREIVLWPNSALSFEILVVARSGVDSAGYQIRGVIENNAGVVNFVGVPVVTTMGEDVAAWSVAVVADGVNSSLSIIVTGAGVAPVRWVAHVRTVEVRL